MLHYRLRIQGEGEQPEELSRLLSEAEELISDGLPEGWYCKIEDEEATGHYNPATGELEPA